MERAIETCFQLLYGTENQLIPAFFPCEPLGGIVVRSRDGFAVDGETISMRSQFTPRARCALVEKRQLEGSIVVDEQHDVKAHLAHRV